ncbi:MAG: phage terminase large subunit [bacterium]|nr:phage terminase large subunit [bacterium]
MRELNFNLTAPQAEFALAEEPYPAFVAGYGTGKTQAAAARAVIRKIMYPRGTVGYYAPTYDLISQFAWPRIESMLEEHGLSYKTNKNEKTITVKHYGKFLFRTMEDPARLVGFETADTVLDEYDTLKMKLALQIWNKVLARNRQKKDHGEKNTIAVATTPEGFGATHLKWVKEAKAGFRLITASTYSNLHNLEPDYIDKLLANYPPHLVLAYVRGLFTNLNSGSIYADFDRDLNSTTETIRPGESLHIGMDFNIYNMSAVVFVIRDGRPLALDEFRKLRDTPAMAEAIRTRYGFKHPITIYPDPAGTAPSSNDVDVSDFVILHKAGFKTEAHAAHPTVKNRIAAVNAQILNGHGERRMLVNVDKCTSFVETLEQQVYDDKGNPDKKSGLDHHGDAAGYFLEKRFPVVGKSGSLIITGV